VQRAPDVHLAGVDLQDLGARVLVGVRELDLAVQPPRPHERRIQDVRPVGGRDHLQNNTTSLLHHGQHPRVSVVHIQDILQ
jgi:hypothetical protein